MKLRRVLYLLVLVLVLALSVAYAQEAAPVFQENFAEGKLNGWAGANATVEISKDFARSDQYSAKVTTHGSGWNRIEYNFAGKLEAGKKYEFTVWLYHETGENLEFHLVRKLGENYTWLGGNVVIPSGQWTKLSNIYEVDAHTDEWLFFVEVYKEGVVYYVDDISIQLAE